MDVQAKQEESTVKEVDSIQYTKADDNELISLVNKYTEAFNTHVMKKTPARNAIRNLLLKMLPKETEAIIADGGQLAGGQG
jgi:ribosomal protein S24E